MSQKRCYGRPPAGVDLAQLSGALIVIEGQDASGRSTQIRSLSSWLEQQGYAVEQVGLRRSELVTPELDRAKQGNILSPRTMSLFYATDFYDQLENRIVPALRAGYIVLADRYIQTLMARDLVRRGNQEWLDSLYSMAIVPDAVYFLSASIGSLVERKLSAQYNLDYWESGMDLGLAPDWFGSHVSYQRKLKQVFGQLQKRYGYEAIDGNRSISAVQRDLRARVGAKLKEVYPSGQGQADRTE